MSYTKGQMVKDLKNAGIRKAEKNGTGSLVTLEHLKYYQLHTTDKISARSFLKLYEAALITMPRFEIPNSTLYADIVFNGSTSAFQADCAGSSPVVCSIQKSFMFRYG